MSSNTAARRIEEAHIKDQLRKQMEAYRRATTERERRNILNGVVVVRRSRKQVEHDYDDDMSTIGEEHEEDNLFPPHGKRGTYSPVYSDPEFGKLAAEHAPLNLDGTQPTAEDFAHGWRDVTKRLRRKRVMTNAELERAAGRSQDENSEEGDHNGDLVDRNQRRDFY